MGTVFPARIRTPSSDESPSASRPSSPARARLIAMGSGFDTGVGARREKNRSGSVAKLLSKGQSNIMFTIYFGREWFAIENFPSRRCGNGGTIDGTRVSAVSAPRNRLYWFREGSAGASHTGTRERFSRRAVQRLEILLMSSEKNASASTSPMKTAFAFRSVTPHQSATVIPLVRSDRVSTSTLM